MKHVSANPALVCDHCGCELTADIARIFTWCATGETWPMCNRCCYEQSRSAEMLGDGTSFRWMYRKRDRDRAVARHREPRTSPRCPGCTRRSDRTEDHTCVPEEL